MTTSEPSMGLVDGWINPNRGALASVDRDVTYLFPGLQQRLERGTTLEQLIDEMDASGVERGVLTSGLNADDDLDWICAAIDKHPDRFVGSHVIDPRRGMESVRLVETLIRDSGFGLIRMMALQTQCFYNDAVYYPVYAKCVELGVPVGLNVGFPGPLVPSKYQDPLPVDEVCAFFPELTVVLQHGGDPWVDICIKLMLKWPSVYYMTSAWAPRHIPAPVLHYANTRGADRVMFASDYPMLPFERCAGEIRDLPFRDEARRHAFASGNATRLFFPDPSL